MGSAPRHDELTAECRTFTRYLLDREPAPDVIAAYQRAHEVSAVESSSVSPSLDAALLGIAGWGPAFVRLADLYAAVFAKSSRLRRKLVLLIAILESRGTTAALIDTATEGSRAVWLLELSGRVAAGVCRLGVASLLVPAVRIWHRLAR